MSFGPDDVPPLDRARDLLERVGSGCIILEGRHQLDLRAVASHVVEEEFALSPDRMDSTGDRHDLVGVLDLGTGFRDGIELRNEVGDAMGYFELVWVGIATGCLDLLHLQLAVGLVLRRVELLVVCRSGGR